MEEDSYGLAVTKDVVRVWSTDSSYKDDLSYSKTHTQVDVNEVTNIKQGPV